MPIKSARFAKIFSLTLILYSMAQLAHAKQSPCENILSGADKILALDTEQKLWQEFGYISKVWRGITRFNAVAKDGVIVEVAPGFSPKVGLGLDRDFHGKYYVIEPEQRALEVIVKKYRSFFPNAEILPIHATLVSAMKMIPGTVDAIYANHPLDDMIVGGFMFAKASTQVFQEQQQSLRVLSGAWKLLERNPHLLRDLVEDVYDEWIAFLKKFDPGQIVIAQYPSYYFSTKGLSFPYKAAQYVMDRLKKSLGESNEFDERLLFSMGHNPKDWLVIKHRKKQLADRMIALPGALQRLGKDIFVETQVGSMVPGENVPTSIFIDPTIASEFVDGNGLDKLNDQIIKYFAIDSEGVISSDGVSVAFSDRQRDPLGIALSGNGGSGRAGYVGDIFNIKGFKTPLATSDDPVHSSGRMRLTSALWEAVAANTVNRNLRTGGSPVLTVIDTGKWFDAGPLGQQRAALVVRLDQGYLDRPAHLFFEGGLNLNVDLETMAHEFGKQEGEKFIERIIHGAWSVGNISVAGHMLDFETVSAVTSRAPQYTVTGWYPDTLFGFEKLGQLEIINAVRADQVSRQLKPPTQEQLTEILEQARSLQITMRLLDLMGFDSAYYYSMDESSQQLLLELSGIFEELSVKMAPNFKAMSSASVKKPTLAVFNFSRFFRYFPMMKNLGTFNMSKALRYLLNENVNFRKIQSDSISSQVHAFLEGQNVITEQSQLPMLKRQAQEFVELYAQVFHCFQRGLSSSREEIIRAWVTNEDRLYFNINFTKKAIQKLVDQYVAGKLSWQQLGTQITLIIKANDRIPKANTSGEIETDVRLFEDGYASSVIDNQGKVFIRFKAFQNTELSRQPSVKIGIENDSVIAANVSPDGQFAVFETARFDLVLLSSLVNKEVFLPNGTKMLPLQN